MPSAKMSPASNSRFQSLVQMVSWNHCASSSVSKSLRNSSMGSQWTNTPPRSKTGISGSVMGPQAVRLVHTSRTGRARNRLRGDLDDVGRTVAWDEIVRVDEVHRSLEDRAEQRLIRIAHLGR